MPLGTLVGVPDVPNPDDPRHEHLFWPGEVEDARQLATEKERAPRTLLRRCQLCGVAVDLVQVAGGNRHATTVKGAPGMDRSPENLAERRRLASLHDALQQLRAADREADEDLIWRWTKRVLEDLFACEEARTKQPGLFGHKDAQDYYKHRNADERGRSLAGLIWVRSLLVHHQGELRAWAWKPLGPHFLTEDGWVPMERSVATANGWEPVETHASVAEWSPRASLPEGNPEKRGREVMYDQRVAGRRLLPPLEEAEAYLLS
ncbi:hypothetical protein [Kineococcus glutinatus]|uniref:Uncharacterized protein n=1 Tax=Kineococcus glutinatus TaxID=1070872 RepID=A0ABP9HJC3_9ACTN